MSIKIKGMSFAFGSRRGDLKEAVAKDSIKLLKADNVDWIALCTDQRVETKHSTEIKYDYKRNLTDVEILEFVEYVHSEDMKVCLKPMINCNDFSWRAEVDFGDDDEKWALWFADYTAYMTHMAELAEKSNCEMLCLGCEMLGMEKREAEWRELIRQVREVYSGPLTYNTNHGHEFDAKWYDELDYLGTSAYFRMFKDGKPVYKHTEGPIMDLTYEDMIKSWAEVKVRMEKFAKAFNKPLIFMEIGCRSAKGCASMPWDFRAKELPFDEDEQANFYKAALETFVDSDYMHGFFWWDWPVRAAAFDMKPDDVGFLIKGKKAEQVLKEYYAK